MTTSGLLFCWHKVHTRLWDTGCNESWVLIPNAVFGYLSTFRIYTPEFTFTKEEGTPETSWMWDFHAMPIGKMWTLNSLSLQLVSGWQEASCLPFEIYNLTWKSITLLLSGGIYLHGRVSWWWWLWFWCVLFFVVGFFVCCVGFFA